jgi:uncharacterized membrane protein YkvI
MRFSTHQILKACMFNRFATKLIAASAVFTWTSSTFAHDGHGLQGSHWHASDVWGFVALGALVVVAVWLSRGDK